MYRPQIRLSDQLLAALAGVTRHAAPAPTGYREGPGRKTLDAAHKEGRKDYGVGFCGGDSECERRREQIARGRLTMANGLQRKAA